MAPRKKTAAKKAAPAAEVKEPKAKTRKAAAPVKKVARRAAAAHAAVITHEPPMTHRQEKDSRSRAGQREHTYTDHRSESYKHYASIMKTIILFLGFVLILAVIANILSPAVNTVSTAQSGSRQSFLDSPKSGYTSQPQPGSQYKQYTYTAPSPVPAVPKP